MNKKGAIAEFLSTIYRIVLVSLIALFVLGSSSLAYSHYIDVRYSEAVIMTKTLVNCVSSNGIVDINNVKGLTDGLINYCIKSGLIKDRFFVMMTFKDGDGKVVETISDGDSGALWVRDLFSKVSSDSLNSIKKYEPGYSKNTFEMVFLNNGLRFKGYLDLEVLVKNER